MAHHYVSMSGVLGCVPQYCASHRTLHEAREDLCSLHELTRRQSRTLWSQRYVDLREGQGAEYAEISECDCATPSDHDDT